MQALIQRGPPKTGEKIASTVLKDITTTETENKFSLAQKRGRPLRVELFPDTPSNTTYSLEAMTSLKKDLGLSTSTTLKLAQGLRAAAKRRNVVQRGLKNHLMISNKKLDEFYSVEFLDFGCKEGIKPLVFCHNVEELVNYVLIERRMFENDLECKVGVDSGGGFLKLCINIFSHSDFENTHEKTKRRKYSDGFSIKDEKNTSVNKLLILAIVPGVPENYENISRFYKVLRFDKITEENVKIRYAADLKMVNLLLGLMAHSSAHPCAWCTIERYVLYF